MPLLDRLGKSRQHLTQPQDIALYLERLLNTRRGTVPQNNALGLNKIPNLGIQNDPELLDQLAAAILEQIKQLEPRLKQPKFQQQQNKLLLTAQLADESSVQFFFQLDNNQLLRIQPVATSAKEVLSYV